MTLYDVARIVEETGLKPADVRGVLKAFAGPGSPHAGDIFLGARYHCRQAAFLALFGPIVEQRQRERQAEAEAVLVAAQAVVERHALEAERRANAARERLERERATIQALRQGVLDNPIRCRRPAAAYRIQPLPAVRDLRRATAIVLKGQV